MKTTRRKLMLSSVAAALGLAAPGTVLAQQFTLPPDGTVLSIGPGSRGINLIDLSLNYYGIMEWNPSKEGNQISLSPDVIVKYIGAFQVSKASLRRDGLLDPTYTASQPTRNPDLTYWILGGANKGDDVGFKFIVASGQTAVAKFYKESSDSPSGYLVTEYNYINNSDQNCGIWDYETNSSQSTLIQAVILATSANSLNHYQA